MSPLFNFDSVFFVSLYVLLPFLAICKIQTGDKSSIINEKGCLSAGEEWLENNLLVVAGVAVGIAFLQVCVVEVEFDVQ